MLAVAAGEFGRIERFSFNGDQALIGAAGRDRGVDLEGAARTDLELAKPRDLDVAPILHIHEVLLDFVVQTDASRT